MNILYLCDEYPPGRHGGIGTAVQLLAREMVKQGHKVVVAGFAYWGYSGKDYFEDNGVVVYRFRRVLSSKILQKQDKLFVRGIYHLFDSTGIFHQDIKSSLVKYKYFLEDIISRYKIDLVEMPDYNDYMRFCKSYVPFPKLSVPVIVKLHGGMTYIARGNKNDVKPYIWQMEHDLLMQADAVCSVSQYNADKTSEYLKFTGPVKVLYNGINTHDMPENEGKVINRVIYTGSLTENKGVYQLMKAWNLVNEQMPSAELWLFGKGPVKKVAKLLTSDALKTVFFKGHVSRHQLFNELTRANVAIFPSFAESFAMAPMEAMACGTAVIYTRTTSGPEIIKDGKDGLLINPENEKEIADKILFLLNNKEVTNTFAENGKNKVIEYFDISISAKKAENYYYTVKNSF